MQEELEGVVEDILFSNEESGFTVLRLRAAGNRVTAVGKLVSPVPGERLRLKGRWSEHPRFGRQFAIEAYEASVPGTVEGIERYLGSGLVPGFGPRLARRIVGAFGERTLEVLEREPEKLAQVEGIGRKRIEALRAAWSEQREIRRVMIFLQSYGAGPALAAKIYKRYGDQAVAVVRENPYRLALDVFGIGFLTADRMARNLGIPADSPSRAEAAVLHVLQECSAEGHLYYPRIPLIQRCQKLLQVDREIIGRAIERLHQEGRLVVEGIGEGILQAGESDPAVYLPAFHTAEAGIASMLVELLNSSKTSPGIDIEKALRLIQRRMEIDLAAKQVQALRSAIESKVLVITGGPGTGKTTIIRSLLAVLSGAGATTLLAAPTGRAAKRMQESSGYEARTIHRLLEFAPRERAFHRNGENPLRCDWLVLDEASMIDAVLMYHLLKALPASSSLVLVGDADQLPSVGPGSVLRDIIASGKVPVVELNEVFRQARASHIVVNAHRINVGLMPLSEAEGDFFFIKREDPREVLSVILRLCTERIPRRFNLDPISDIQVLSPMHRGTVGVSNLNRVLQEALNPAGTAFRQGETILKPGDKVMQIRNNYDKEVFNGDIGRLEAVDSQGRSLAVRYEDRRVIYEPTELDELTLAYAVSVHKAQGSEFPAVIVPVLTEHYPLLQRNLIYTAVTRGKELVILVGTRRALAMALKNTDTQERFTGLRRRLAGTA